MPASRVPSFFRRIALVGWAKSPYYTYCSGYPVFRRWLIAQLSAKDKKILSVGCGSGELERDLLKLGRRVFGIDICYEMLQSAQRRGVTTVMQADALNLPFASSSFDLVLFPESIGYFRLGAVLSGVARVLKRSGRLLLTAYPPHFAADSIYRRHTAENLSTELSQNGFRVMDRRLLAISRRRIIEVTEEARSQVIYIVARNGHNKNSAPFSS